MIRKLTSRLHGAWRFVRLYSQHLPFAWEAIFGLRCFVTSIEGRIRGSDERLVVAFAGRWGRNYPWLLERIFDGHEIREWVETTVPSFRRHLERMVSTADLIVVDIGWPYHALVNRGGEFLEVPDWVNMAIDLQEDWTDVVRGFRQTARNNDLRLIRRNDYRYVITNDPVVIGNFYDQQYLPFVTSKHHAASIVAPKRHVVRRACEGGLLQVSRDGENVVSGVIYPEGKALYFLWMGIASHCVDNPPEGAVSALYYFGIRHAFEQGYDVVDFTGTRAFLSDGPFRFKRKWGAVVEDTFSPSSILIRPKAGRLPAAIFCEQNPLLARRAGELEAIVLVRGRQIAGDVSDYLSKQFWCSGIERVTLVEISDRNEARPACKGPDGCQYRHVRTRLEDFANYYLRREPTQPQET